MGIQNTVEQTFNCKVVTREGIKHTVYSIHYTHCFVRLCFVMLMLSGGRFKNANELLNLRALKISMLYKKSYLSMYELDILRGISKGTFEIPNIISHPYIERCGFY